MEHANAKTALEERPIAMAPRAEFRPIRLEPRDVVPAIIVDHQQTAARPQDSIGLGQVGRIHAAKSRPQPDYRVHGLVPQRRAEWRGLVTVDEPCSERCEAIGQARAGRIYEQHVAINDGPQCFEAAENLPLDVEGRGQLGACIWFEAEGEI